MTAVLSSPGVAPPPVRIRRAPALEPPADDVRRADDHPICPGQLALFTSVHGIRVRAEQSTRRVPKRPAGTAHPPARAAGPPPPRTTAGAAVVPAQIAASRFVAACVEVLNGFRPVAHLRALTTPVEFDAITTQLTRRTMRVRLPGRGTAGQTRISLRRLRTFEQRAGVAEAVAVLHHGETFWAMALRFEHRRGNWLCTLLEVV